jgi:antitoxin component YwqK of YwqJK toxin-antitoxin module
MKLIKSILFLAFLLGFGLPSMAQQRKNDVKIKSIIVYTEKHDMLVNKRYKDYEEYYDEKGNLLEEINYKQGKISKHFRYQYDADGNKIKEEKIDPSGKIVETSEYKIENGLRVEKIVYDGNGKVKTRKEYQYTTY